MKVVFDVETKSTFMEAGSSDPSRLGISFVGVYRSDTDEYLGFWENELHKMWPIFEAADEVIGYNSKGFDYPALAPYYAGDLFELPTLDLLEVVKNSLGRRIKLDSIAVATLGQGKIGNGLDAVRYWKNNELDKLEKYCIEDVKVTWEVYQYAKKQGSLYYLDKANDKKSFQVQWSAIKPVESFQQTLGI